MVYNPNIPAANDALSVSQGQIQTNFSDADTYFGVNHHAFSAVSNNGKHKAIQMTQVTNPTVGATEAAVYTKAGTYNTNPQVFFRQGTTNTIFNATESSLSTSGWAYLPNGLLIKWGTDTPSATGLITVLFPTGATIPVFTSAYQIFLTLSINTSQGLGGQNVALLTGSLLTTEFKYSVNSIANTPQVKYFVLGA